MCRVPLSTQSPQHPPLPIIYYIFCTSYAWLLHALAYLLQARCLIVSLAAPSLHLATKVPYICMHSMPFALCFAVHRVAGGVGILQLQPAMRTGAAATGTCQPFTSSAAMRWYYNCIYVISSSRLLPHRWTSDLTARTGPVRALLRPLCP